MNLTVADIPRTQEGGQMSSVAIGIIAIIGVAAVSAALIMMWPPD
jgi:hypothetical protein